MSLEIKLVDEKMGFWNKHKKKVIGPLVAGMIATGVAGGVDKSHNGDINLGTPSASAATSAQASVNYKLPGAIAADPDWAVHDAWGAMKTGTGHSLYNLYGKDYAIAVLRLDSNANVGTQFKKVDELTMQTSHAFYLAVAQTDKAGSWLKTHYIKDNISLSMFYSAACKVNNDVRNYDKAKILASDGLFAATSVGAGELGNYKRKADAFRNSSANQKEIMLREEFSKFSKTKANPQTRNVNSMEYKMLSAYYNLGIYILAEAGTKDRDIAISILNGQTYSSLNKKFGFHSASRSLL